MDYTRCDTEKIKKYSFLTLGGFYMKQISMDFNKRQYMRPVDFELFYYNDTELRSVASHHHDYCEFLFFFWKEMSNTTSAMLYTNFPTVTAC
mgnify:CR=1 FL=1